MELNCNWVTPAEKVWLLNKRAYIFGRGGGGGGAKFFFSFTFLRKKKNEGRKRKGGGGGERSSNINHLECLPLLLLGKYLHHFRT